MRQFSKLSSQVTKAASVRYGERILAPCIIYLQNNSIRLYSDGVNFLDNTTSTSIKRGAGGRSSYSGVTATVFGATGFLGRYVCDRLGKIGSQMIIPYRSEVLDLMHLKVAGDLGQVLFTPFHVCDEESIRKAVKHSNVVINLLGCDWNTPNFTIHQANAESAERIVRISKEMGVKKFIHVSSLNCDREYEGFLKRGGSEFLKAKGLSELMVRDVYPDAILFRPSSIYGQEDRFFWGLMNKYRFTYKQIIALPNQGKGIWKQPVYSTDVADGIIEAVCNPDSVGKTYEAVGPRRYELCDLVNWFHRVTRKDGEDYGHRIIDTRYDPITQIKARIFERGPTDPVGLLTTDSIEREAVSDITSSNPNLEDLGVNLTSMENRIHFELKMFQGYRNYEEKFGEFENAQPPPFQHGY